MNRLKILYFWAKSILYLFWNILLCKDWNMISVDLERNGTRKRLYARKLYGRVTLSEYIG